MNYIGSVIRKMRERQGLSRLGLSRDICSEKYLYMIERGDRTPSAQIIRFFSLRLGVDLFGYFEFLDCQNPVAVHDAVAQFNTCRVVSDFAAAKALGDRVKRLPDFQKLPWKYELLVNDAAYMVYVEHRYQDGADYVRPILENMEPRYREEDFVANFLVALSSCYMEFKDFRRAGETVSQAEKIIQDKENIARYHSTVISVKLNKMSFCHFTGDFDGAIREGLWIHRFQTNTKSYELANFTYYYLAYAYYQKGMPEEAFSWFERCLFDLIVHPSEVAAYFISRYEHFYAMLHDPKINPALAERVTEQYHLAP